MAKYCTVAPINVLEYLNRETRLGAHHLVLAHDIVKPDRQVQYAKIFQQPRFELVILDNSVVETGNAVDVGMMKEATAIVNPTCVVLPDIQHEAVATVNASMNAMEDWPTIFPYDTQFMFLPQGKTFQEFAWAAEQSIGIPGISWWGIPRNLVSILGTRRDAIKVCRMLAPYRNIHLFGFSDNMIDDAICAHEPGVQSIDSAVPVRFTKPFRLTEVIEPRGNWWEEAKPSALTWQNIERAKQYFG